MLHDVATFLQVLQECASDMARRAPAESLEVSQLKFVLS